MRALRAIWETPRIWRYAAVAAITFTVGGTGTALATSSGLTQLVYQAGSTMYFAHIDSGGNLAVNDASAGTALGTANTHLSSIDTKLTGPLAVSGNVAITGTPTVLTGDTTVEIASGLAQVSGLVFADFGNVISRRTVAAYRDVVLYIALVSGTNSTAGCTTETYDSAGNMYLLESFNVSGTSSVHTYDPAPVTFEVTCSSALTGSENYQYMLLGRS